MGWGLLLRRSLASVDRSNMAQVDADKGQGASLFSAVDKVQLSLSFLSDNGWSRQASPQNP